jgi:transcription termination factor Rho
MAQNGSNSATPQVIDIEGLRPKKIAELTSLAKTLGITHFSNLRKQELILKIVEAQTKAQPVELQIEGLKIGRAHV